MWGRPRTSDRIGEELPPPFSPWLISMDPLLTRWRENGIFDAFCCRRAYHHRNFLGTTQMNTDRATGCLVLVLAILCCGWAHIGGILVGFWFFRWLVGKIQGAGGSERKPQVPDSINHLIQNSGIQVDECMDLWMTGQSGHDFADAMYLETRRGAEGKIRLGQAFVALLLFGPLIGYHAETGRLAGLIAPFALIYIMLAGWMVWQLKEGLAISGMSSAAEDLRSRRTSLIRAISGHRFWQIDSELKRSAKRLLRATAVVIAVIVAIYLSVAAVVIVESWQLRQSGSALVRFYANNCVLLILNGWLVTGNWFLRRYIRNRHRHVADARASLRYAGWGFEVVLVCFSGAGDAELGNWMSARRAADEDVW